MRKYIIVDNEAMSFKEWTHKKPQTAKEIKEDFYCMGKYQEEFETLKKDYTLNYICDMWNVSIYYINKKGLAVNLWDNTEKLVYSDKFKLYLQEDL